VDCSTLNDNEGVDRYFKVNYRMDIKQNVAYCDVDILKTLQDIRVRLLDLSKRNRLPNFRHNRFCLRIVDEQSNQVYDYPVFILASVLFGF
jgi:hypothetical protein